MFKEEEITTKLKNLKFQPSNSWQVETLNKLSMYTDKSNLFVKFFKMMMMSKKRLGLIAGGSIVAGFLILVGGLILINQMSRGIGLTPGQKQEIFKQIINNNPSTVLSSDERDSRIIGEAATLANDIASSSPSSTIFVPETRDYSYRYSKTTYNKGAASGRCQNMIYDDSLYTSESYEFFGSNSDTYYKYIQRDIDGDLNSYSLNNSTSTSSEYIEYRGGNYAIKSSYTFDSSVGVLETGEAVSEDSVGSSDNVSSFETPTDYNALTELYFGPDADIISTITLDGQEYYIVQYTYKTDCSGAAYDILTSDVYDPSTLPDTIVVQNYVNSSTFEIQQTFNYLGSADTNNLITNTIIELESSNADFSQVSNNFNFDFNVEIRDITYPEYNAENEANKLVNYLAGNNMNLLFVNNATLQSAYSNDLSIKDFALYNYYADRNFYPAGAKGDAMFEANNRSYGLDQTPSLVSLSYYLNSSTNDYITIDTYSSSAVLPDPSQTPTSTSDVNLNIDNQLIAAKLYEYEVNFTPIIMRDIPEGFEVPTDTEVTYILTREVVFEYAGFKYKMSLPQREDFDISTVSFEALNTSNSSDMALITQRIIDVFLNPKVLPVEGEGRSGSGTTVVDPVAPETAPSY